MQVQFSWVRQTKQHHVYIAHFTGVDKGVTFPIPKALSAKMEKFVVNFPTAQSAPDSNTHREEKPDDRQELS